MLPVPPAVRVMVALFAAAMFWEMAIPPDVAFKLMEVPVPVVVTVFPKLIAPPATILISPPLVVTFPDASPN
jgi:hypothetical protein